APACSATRRARTTRPAGRPGPSPGPGSWPARRRRGGEGACGSWLWGFRGGGGCRAGIAGCGRGIVPAAAEHVLADHLDDVDRRSGECDLLAGFQGLQVAARLQADVTLAEQAVGEDAGGGVAGQVVVAAVDVQ